MIILRYTFPKKMGGGWIRGRRGGTRRDGMGLTRWTDRPDGTDAKWDWRTFWTGRTDATADGRARTSQGQDGTKVEAAKSYIKHINKVGGAEAQVPGGSLCTVFVS